MVLLPVLLLCATPHAAAGAAAEDVRFVADPTRAVAATELRLRGAFNPPGLVALARVRVRTAGTQDFVAVDMVKVPDPARDVWEARVDASRVRTPALEYFVVVKTRAGKPLVVAGSADAPLSLSVAEQGDPLPPDENDTAPANPLETAEERELRTGERQGGGTLGTAGAGTLRRTRAQPADNVVASVAVDDKQQLTEEFRVFAAEDATAIASTYQQPARTAPAIITVIPRSRIEQMGARSLLDILKVVPGFETSRTILGFDEVTIRGTRSDPEILLLVDGHRVANLYDGRIPWAVPADIIERVEVIRGPGSALYGTGAFLGVVNVITREHEFVRVRTGTTFFKPSPLMLKGEGLLPTYKDPNPYNPDNDVGAAGLMAPDGSVSAGVNRAGVKAYGNAYARVSRGQRIPVREDAFTNSGIIRSPKQMQTDGREARVAASAKVDVAPPVLRGGHGFARTYFQYEDRGPTFGVFDTLGPRSQLAWILGTADVGYAQPFLDGGEVLVRAYGDGHFVDRRLQLSPDGYELPDLNGDGARELWKQGVQTRTTYVTNALGAEARVLTPQVWRHRFNVGMQGEANVIPFYRFSLNRDAKGAALNALRTPDATVIPQRQDRAWRITGALYLQDEWRVLDRLFVTVGVRANLFSDVRWDPRTHITPRAALVFEPVDDLAFKLLYGSAFRAPTFEEKYDQTSLAYSDFSPGNFKGNTRLEPEYIHTAEGGVDWAFNLAGFRYRVAGNAFYSFVGNSIDRIDETGAGEPVRNRGFRHIGGVEGEGRVEFAPGTYLFANATFHRSWFVDPDPGATKRLDWLDPGTYVDAIRGFPNSPDTTRVSYLTNTPQFRANAGANVELFQLVSFYADVRVGSERRNTVRSTLERLRTYRIPSYVLCNVGFRTRPILGWFGVEGYAFNALDFDYRDDVPRPDRVKDLLPRDGQTVMLGVYLQH